MFWRRYLSSFLALTLTWAVGSQPVLAEGTFRIGVAEADITPPQGFLVAGYFMHLMSERKTIYAILLTTAFFFAGLMYLIVWSREEMPRGTRWHTGPNTSSQIQNAQ